MGSLILVCPMCCGETFDSYQSLKYHLLTMMDDFFCPGCKIGLDSLTDLIQHLDKCETTDNVIFESTAEDLKLEENEVLMDTNVEQIHESFLDHNEKIMIVGGPRTIEVDENGGIKVVHKMDLETEVENEISETITDELGNCNNIEEENVISTTEEGDMDDTPVISIPETEDLGDDDEKNVIAIFEDDSAEFLEDDQNMIEVESQAEDLGDDEDMTVKQEIYEIDGSGEYSCSTCGIAFDSVLEHIQQYHDGHQVVVEALEDSPNLETDVTEQETDESPVSRTRPRQTMNTLRTEECLDSEGRLYTRKVVQIERFWDRTNDAPQSSPKQSSMIEKFFSNTDGTKTAQKPETAPQRTYRCNQCLEQFTRIGEFRTHVCLNGNNQCDQCDQAFATVKALQLHVKVHETESDSQKMFICAVCGTEFTTHKSLRLHSRMHAPVRARHVDAPEGDGDSMFTCHECGKTLSESYRSAHMALHTGDSVTCAVCNRKFDSAESLSMHVVVHPELGISQNQSFTLNQQLTSSPSSPIPSESSTSASNNAPTTIASSRIADDGDLTKPYQCQHCGRRFTRPHEKVKHERIHTGEKPHACEVCGKTFRVSYCLTLHMRTHTGVRPYECKHCGKRFKASSVYNHHLLTHGEARAYKCTFCAKTFKTRVQLSGHKNSHTKPFRCTECSRPFASLYAARAHIATHKKDNNLKFCCYVCGASYGRAFALNDHMKNHGPEVLPPPEAAREEEVQEDFLLDEEITEEELIPHQTIMMDDQKPTKKFEDSE